MQLQEYCEMIEAFQWGSLDIFYDEPLRANGPMPLQCRKPNILHPIVMQPAREQQYYVKMDFDIEIMKMMTFET